MITIPKPVILLVWQGLLMVEGGDPCWRINWFDLSGDGEDRLAKKPREQELQNDRYHLSLNIYPAILRSYKLITSDGKRILVVS